MKGPALVAMLKGGDRRSIGRAEEAAAEVLADPTLFRHLVRAMQAPHPVVRMRAADAVEKVTRHNPILLNGHKKKFLGSLANLGQKEVRWHVAQVIPRLSLNPRERRRAVEILQWYLEDPSSIVRTSAMQSLAEIALTDRRLRGSVLKTLSRLTETGTPAMRARGKKLLARLKETG